MNAAFTNVRLTLAIGALAMSALAACASSPNGVPSRPSTQPVVLAPGTPALRITTGDGPDVATVPFALETVWSVMPLVFDSLHVPIAKVEPGTHIIGNDGFKVRQRLGKTALSRFIDCGQAQIGPNADSYDVMLTVVTTLAKVDEQSTRVTTSVLASAKPVTYNQGYSQCSTKGGLEAKVVSTLRTALAK